MREVRMIAFTLIKHDKRFGIEIDDKHADREFGGIPLSMIGSINLGPFAPSVPATMPDAKPVEKERGRRRNIEHEPTDALI
jgi:soluble lytic murein transglycosylase-like protein